MVAANLKVSIFAALLPSTRALKVAACGGVTTTFEEFVQRYERQYSPGSDEYAKRQALFEGRAAHIANHNCAEKPWEAGVNHLSDWTEEELQGLRGFMRGVGPHAARPGASSGASPVRLDADDPSLPTTFTWGHLDAISSPTDQGSCGSCWAYAAGAVLNAHSEIHNRSQKYSIAQIVACTPNPQHCGGSGGCDGATVTLAYEYALTSGLMSDADFPALPGGAAAACPADQEAPDALLSTGFASKSVVMPDGSETHALTEVADGIRTGRAMGMLGWTLLPRNKEKPMMSALVEYGPLAVAVAAGQEWNWYNRGILTPEGCDTNHVISHAVVLYGYGKIISQKFGEVKYWKIKNSWGKSWGEEGMLRLQRVDDEDEQCGWDNAPLVGSGCTGGPSKVWVCGSCGILYETVMPVFH
jgi:cathepsin L